MSKLWFTILIFILSRPCPAQTNYCRYFRLNIEEPTYNGKKVLAINPEIISIPGDSLSVFISSHASRFEYILYNKLDSLKKYSEQYPDTAAIHTQFCADLRNNNSINKYLLVLTGQSEDSEIFSEREMMRIASRFFLCDKINKSDTTIGYHICIGINGQKEFDAERDYTTLEAFCFEAIFHYYGQGRPKFVSNFINQIQESLSKNKKEFKDFEHLLEVVRADCFNDMENDESLKASLLQFYHSNKDNISIKII